MDEDRDAIDVREMLRSPGWSILRGEIEDMILADESRITSMEVHDRSATDIGTEYLYNRRHADGLKDVLSVAQEYGR